MVVVVLVLLLVLLATLQYRWIAQLSEAERTRLEASLQRATTEFCEDFDREITNAYTIFNRSQSADEQELPQLLNDRLREWRSRAMWPEMVKELSIIRLTDTNEIVLLRFNEATQSLLQVPWDEDLLPVRSSLANPGRGLPAVAARLPGLVMVIQGRRVPEAGPPFEWSPPRDHLLVRFDLDFIRGTILPQLAATHLGHKGDLDYAITVSPADRPEQIIFQTGGRPSPPSVKPDATDLLLGLRPAAAHGGPRNNELPPDRPHPPEHFQQGRAQASSHRPPPEGPLLRMEQGKWVLAVYHPAGSLEGVVAGARRRNLAISIATLAMLGATALLMLVSTRRAQQLARQQMAFVATISHELRTPLTAIRSAGQNLAEGIISDPPKVRSYGLLIEREGRRLTEMIGRVLAYAGIRSGRQILQMAPVDVPEIVEAALEDCRWTLEEKSIDVDKGIAPDLPSVLGDASALRLVVSNLIDNAIKYGAPGRWLGVSAGLDATQTPREVWVSISDHGPGIPRREQRHLFEAFRRGADAAAGNVPGSGLGLAVVRGVIEAHGGSIDIISTPENGTTFTFRLPAKLREIIKEEDS